MRRWIQLPFIGALLALHPGCQQHDVVRPNYRPLTFEPRKIGWTNGVTLVGDSQKFHIGSSAFLFRSGFTDRYLSNSALRVPQEDLFGDSLLALALVSDADYTVHLGDALDLSCTDEWRDFVELMNASGRAWFWTPGNHDGYFFGNFVGPPQQWEAGCHPALPMTKDVIIREYLTAHLARYAGSPLDGVRGSWACPPGATCNGLSRVAWRIVSGDHYHASYVMQEMVLAGRNGVPDAALIVVDTTTYDRPPRISLAEHKARLAAGEAARLGNEQLALLEQWVAHAVGEGRTIVLAGHHPFRKLDAPSRDVIDRLIRVGRATTYISADVHWGQYFTHSSPDGYSWLEASLGSVADYDAEFATLFVGYRGATRFIKMPRTTISTAIAAGVLWTDTGIRCDAEAWLAGPADDDFYTRYMESTSPRPTEAELLYYSTMLAALDRYWRCVPTTDDAKPMPDQCIVKPVCKADSEIHAEILDALESRNLDRIRATAVDLVARDRSRNADPCVRRAYKVCQALWASEYELREYLSPVKGKDLFEVDTIVAPPGR